MVGSQRQLCRLDIVRSEIERPERQGSGQRAAGRHSGRRTLGKRRRLRKRSRARALRGSMAHLAALELQSIGKGLFVSAHKGSELLFSQLACLYTPCPISSENCKGRESTLMNNPPSSESISEVFRIIWAWRLKSRLYLYVYRRLRNGRRAS